MNSIIVRLFYFLLLYITFPKFNSLLSVDFNATNLFAFAPDQNLLIFCSYLAFVISAALCCAFPVAALRVLTAVSFTVMHVAFKSQSETSYNLFSWHFAAIVMIFWKNAPNDNARNRNIVTAVQVFILASYFSSGLWKLRSFFDAPSVGDYFNGVLDQIAFASAAGVGPVNFVSANFDVFKYVIIAGFPLVLLFQLTAFVPVIFRRYLPYWGVAAIVFHFATGLFMRIWFECHQVATCLFLIIIPLYFYSSSHFADAESGQSLQKV